MGGGGAPPDGTGGGALPDGTGGTRAAPGMGGGAENRAFEAASGGLDAEPEGTGGGAPMLVCEIARRTCEMGAGG